MPACQTFAIIRAALTTEHALAKASWHRGLNALAESHMGLYKSELIHSFGPWKGLQHVEAATLDWVHWFNTSGLTSRPKTRPDPGRTDLLHSPNPPRRGRLTPNEASGLAGAAHPEPCKRIRITRHEQHADH